jgi:cytochrome P450
LVTATVREGHNTKAFLYFGAGPRFCPGRYLASLEMKMVLATLSRNFSVAYA